MELSTIGALTTGALLLLLAIGMPLVGVFQLVGVCGMIAILSWDATLAVAGETFFATIAVPTYTVLPLFILMGAFAARGGFARQAFDAIHIAAARLPASLAIASSFGSAIFAAVCRSTMASTAVMGRIAYPSMVSAGYDKKFALGSIASSGTFACMIPPSGMFILFSLFTGQSVVAMFMGGILPGLITACVYALSMVIRAKLHPEIAPISEEEKFVTLPQRGRALLNTTPVMFLAVVVLGGMYTGFFTADEGGAVGALGTLLLGIWNGELRNAKAIKDSLRETARITTMLIFIIVTAMMFSRFLAITRLPMDFAEMLMGWKVNRWLVLLAILGLWFIMGMFMAQAAVFALTLPILFPVIMNYGFDPIWFCIIAMKINEIAGVTPPVGMSVFSLVGVVREDNVRIEDVYKGCAPFILCDLVVLVLLFIFPSIATFLPDLMMSH